MTMKSVDLPHLRSVVLAGHAGAGKTTLAEQLLFKAGAIPRLGRVDDGTAHLDFEPEEQKRQESLSLAVGTFEARRDADLAGRHARLPGLHRRRHRGLRGRRRGDLRDGRVGAASRPASSTRSRSARATDTAACFFINKSDRENADPTAALDALRASFGDKIAPLQLAIGAAESFEGYVDLVHRKAWRWDGTTEVEIPIPDELAGEVAPPARPAARGRRRGRRRRPDQVPRGRGDLRPGARGVPAQGRQGDRSWRRSSSAARPRASACAACSTRSSATSPPRPTSRRPRPTDKAGATVEVAGRRERPAPRPRLQDDRRPVRRPADLPARPVGHAPLAGARLEQHAASEDERIGQLLLLHGKEQEPIGELKAGEIGAVAKLAVTETGDTLSPREKPLVLPPLGVPRAVADGRHRAAEQGRPRQDGPGPRPDARGGADRPARAQRDRRAGPADDGRGPHRGHHRAAQAQVRGGHRDPHAARSRTRRRSAARPRSTAATRSRPAGTGCSATSGWSSSRTPTAASSSPSGSSAASVPKGFFAGVEKGIREAAEGGVIAGYPLSDFRATLYDGSFHPVDSNELSFKIAASMALKDGVHHAKPALLEPIMAVEIRDPRGLHGRGQPRPQRPARPGPRDGHRRRHAGHHRPRPAGRAVQLRDGAALTGPGPRLVHRDARPLRGRPGRTSPRRSSRPTARSSRRPAGTAPGTEAPRRLRADPACRSGARRDRQRRREVEAAFVEGSADDRAGCSRSSRTATRSVECRDAARRDDRAAAERDEPLVEGEVRTARGGRRARSRSPRRSRTPASGEAADRIGGVDARRRPAIQP